MKFTKEDTQKVKGIAIILMLIHHCFLDPDRYAGKTIVFAPFTEECVNWWALFFKICVAIFVFLSAYGITLSFQKVSADYRLEGKQISKILVQRYIKLMMGFFFVFLLLQIYSAIFQGRYQDVYGDGETSVIYMLIDMFGLADLLGTPMFVATFWYMTMAQLIIIAMPICIWLYKKLGLAVIPLSFFAAKIIPWSYYYFQAYLVCIVTAMVFADKDLFVKIREKQILPRGNKIAKFLLFVGLFLVLAVLRESSFKGTFIQIWETLIPIVLICFNFEFVNPLPVIGRILEVLGKYSMNIFLIHNFIRVVWYYDFTYGFKYVWLIVLVLLVISLVISVAIEWLKKMIHYNQLTQWLVAKVEKF